MEARKCPPLEDLLVRERWMEEGGECPVERKRLTKVGSYPKEKLKVLVSKYRYRTVYCTYGYLTCTGRYRPRFAVGTYLHSK